MKIIYSILSVMLFLNIVNATNFTENGSNEQIAKDLEIVRTLKQHRQENSGVDFLTVGGDAQCSYNNIQDAIDDFAQSPLGNIEIRIANNKTYTENLLIDNLNLTLTGGYDNCTISSQSGSPGGLSSEIDGNGALLPVLRITGALQRNSIFLKNITLKNGTGTGLQKGGGVNAFDANAQVLLDNVDIRGNAGTGLAIIGGTTTDTDIVMNNTLISNNTADLTGGGIYCEGMDASIIMGKDSGITFNQATEINAKGGGAYITSSCSFSMYSSGMVSNTAKNGGGGIYAEGGAHINLIGRKVCSGNECLGDDIRPVRFNANRGDSDSSDQGNGGAVYMTGASTLINMSQVWIDDNTAFNGGAISVHDNAQLYIQRFSRTCWNSHIDDKCNLLESNLASSSNGRGGAIYNDDGVILVNQTYLENNRADFGTAVYATGESAVSVVDGSIFNNNGNDGITYQDAFVIGATGGAEYLIVHSTFADNHATGSVFNVSSSLNSMLTLKNSIVHDSSSGNILNSNSPGMTEFECILAHEVSSIDGFSLFVDDPEFIDRNSGNYHLNALISPAIDKCSSVSGSDDIDTDLRGWDDSTVTNQDNNPDAIFDAGADESYDNDIIFNNEFE